MKDCPLWCSALVSRVGLFVAVFVGCAAAGLLLWIGFQHNSQGEFFDAETGEYSWYTLQFFVINAVIIGTPVFLLVGMVRLLLLWFGHVRAKRALTENE